MKKTDQSEKQVPELLQDPGFEALEQFPVLAQYTVLLPEQAAPLLTQEGLVEGKPPRTLKNAP